MYDLSFIEKVIQVYVFSYNRGPFLFNCIESLEKCIPDLPVKIIDDRSNDYRTLEILEKLSTDYNIYQPSIYSNNDEYKTGGLYSCMNYALKDAYKSKIKYALFIQDDMQIARQIDNKDYENFDKYFLDNPNSCELYTCFMKLKYRESDDKDTHIDKSKTAYLRNDSAVGNIYFSAPGLFYVRRYKRLIGDILSGEANNEHNVKNKGVYMGVYAWPFMHWLPFPKSHRGKNRNISHRLFELIGGAGIHPINYMTRQDINDLFSREIKLRPYAENYLISPSAPKVKYWSTQGGKSNTNRRDGWRRVAGRVISVIKYYLNKNNIDL